MQTPVTANRRHRSPAALFAKAAYPLMGLYGSGAQASRPRVSIK
jgi:hypothetical protein